MRQIRTSLELLYLVALCLGQAQAQELIEKPQRIPVPWAGSKGLEALMIRPDDAIGSGQFSYVYARNGRFSYVYARHSDKGREKLALARCKKLASRDDRCQLVDWRRGGDSNSRAP